VQTIKYRIHTAEGGVQITEKHHEALDAMREGLRVQSRRVSVNIKGTQTPLGGWREEKPPEPPVPVIEYRVYLNPRESFDTLSREKAVEHWQRGLMVYSRETDKYSTGRLHPTGYWRAHPPKEIIPVPDGTHYGDGAKRDSKEGQT